MSLDDEIQYLLERLRITRATLAHYLNQRSLVGRAHTRPEVSHGIAQAREDIRHIIETLRTLNVPVEDYPDDADDVYAKPEHHTLVMLSVALLVIVMTVVVFAIWNNQAPRSAVEGAIAHYPVPSSLTPTMIPNDPISISSMSQTMTPSAVLLPSATPLAIGTLIGCFTSYFADVPPPNQVLMVVDSNVRDKRRLESGFSGDDRFGIVFIQNGQPIGAVRVRKLPSNAGFLIEAIVDANCVATGTNGDTNLPRQITNWGNATITIGKTQYSLYMGSGAIGAPVEIITKQL